MDVGEIRYSLSNRGPTNIVSTERRFEFKSKDKNVVQCFISLVSVPRKREWTPYLEVGAWTSGEESKLVTPHLDEQASNMPLNA